MAKKTKKKRIRGATTKPISRKKSAGKRKKTKSAGIGTGRSGGSRATQFTKENASENGKKGGVKGRGPQLTTFLRRAIFDSKGALTKDGLAIVGAAIKVSRKGNVQMIKEVFSRMDGNVPNKIEAQIDHGVLTDLSEDDLAAIVGTDSEDADR